MSVQLDDIMLEITRDNAPLCDEFGDPILDEAGNDIYLEQPGFVDVWPDVLVTRDAEFSYGIFGNHLTDRVGGIGTGSFRLNNSESNTQVRPASTQLSDYFDTTSGTGLTVNNESKVVGENSFKVAITDTTARYGQLTVAGDPQTIVVAGKVRVSELTMANNNAFRALECGDATDAGWFRLQIQYTTVGGFLVLAQYRTDEGSFPTTSSYSIADGDEIKLAGAISSGANNGSIQLIVNGVVKQTITGIDNDTAVVDRVRAGGAAGLDAGTSGNLYLDNIWWGTTNDVSAASDYLDFEDVRLGRGAFSPDHANFVGGFERETLVKLTLEKSGARKVKWRGVVKDIKVEPGQYAGRFVDVECEDFMVLLDDFADMNLQAIQTNITSDALYTAITNAMLRKFPTVDFSPNPNALTYGFDTANRQKATARNEINKIALSVMDSVFIQADNYEGAKLTSQTYADRIANQTNSFTLSDSAIRSLQISRTEKIDRSVSVIHPRSVGTANEILYTLNVPGTGKAQGIYPGETYTFTADYRDPDQTSSRIAAASLASLTASTDYKLGRGNGDSSEDLNGSATIVVTAGATSADISITNNHAMLTMYINFFQLQGIAIRQYEAVETVVDVDNPIGDKELRFDLPYEDDRVAATAIAELGKVVYQDGFTAIDGVTYLANRDATHLGYLMDIEPGMRGTVSETQSGINQSGFVNSVSLRFYGKEYCDVTYGIERAQPVDGNFWLLEEVGMSEIGDSTYVFGV